MVIHVDNEKTKRIGEFEEKIHKLRMDKLLHIEYIVDKIKKNDEQYTKLTKSLDDAHKTLMDCPLEEISRYKTIIKAIEAKIKVLSSQTQALNKLRLLQKNLMIEESKLYVLKRDEE